MSSLLSRIVVSNFLKIRAPCHNFSEFSSTFCGCRKREPLLLPVQEKRATPPLPQYIKARGHHSPAGKHSSRGSIYSTLLHTPSSPALHGIFKKQNYGRTVPCGSRESPLQITHGTQVCCGMPVENHWPRTSLIWNNFNRVASVLHMYFCLAGNNLPFSSACFEKKN